MGSSLAGSEADDAGFHSAVPISQERAAEVSSFVIRMRRDAEQAKHALIVADMQSFAETVQSFAFAEIVSSNAASKIE
jgi:hypothetical protein